MSTFAKISILVMLLPFSVWAFQTENQDYLPLSPAELSKHFPVEYVGTLRVGRPGDFAGTEDRPLPPQLACGVSGAAVSLAEEEGLLIAGKDKLNKSWSVNLGDAAFVYAGRFYVADLDRNGIRDLVLVVPTGGNGLAPSSHLFSLTFDEQGRPVSFEADGYFDYSNKDISDLVDLDGDGRAELIYMNFDDGYWITNLYEIRNARWQLIKGAHGRRVYPMYTRFTNSPNRKAVVPKHGRHPFAPDLSNNSPKLEGRLLSYRWADVSHSEDIVLTMQTKQGKQVLSKPVSWYSSFAVVLETREGRRIISLSAGEAAMKAALDEIIAQGYQVSLYGERRPDTSSPEILWARPKDN